MKIRSLLLGSVAAAGLSTGAFAADLGVLTSLDVCDSLGLSGLTISSDTNCLQISGGVKYEFSWGDYRPAELLVEAEAGDRTVAATGGEPKFYDWDSRLDYWLKFVGTADSDFGQAKAVIKIEETQQLRGFGRDEGWGDVYHTGSDTDGIVIDEAYVSIGDSTVIMAGKKGSIVNKGDDVPLNFLGLFNSAAVDTGVNWMAPIKTGGHVIQVTSDLGNGLSVGAGLEALDQTWTTMAGTIAGVLAYSGDGITAHVSVAGGGILDGNIEEWGIHAGFSGSFDNFKVVAAVAADSTDYWNALASASATFDMFTLAISGEAAKDTGPVDGTDYGFGASAGFAVSDGVTINVGGRWYYDDSGNAGAGQAGWQAAAQVVAAVTETITLTGEVGVYGNDDGVTDDADTFYGSAQVAWAPGGGFTSSLKGEVYANGAYKATFKAAKTFE